MHAKVRSELLRGPLKTRLLRVETVPINIVSRTEPNGYEIIFMFAEENSCHVPFFSYLSQIINITILIVLSTFI